MKNSEGYEFFGLVVFSGKISAFERASVGGFNWLQ